MSDRTRRARELRACFPAAYDTRPRGSALGELLDTLAGGLADLDETLTQVLHNRWLRLAREHATPGDPDPLATQRACLTQLGRLVGVVPLPREPLELLRRRLHAQARILRDGVTTPRAILGLAATALGLELCGRLDRPPPRGGARITVGHAVTPGTSERCQQQSGRPCGRSGPCPQQAAREAQLLLIDNPPDDRTRRLLGLRPGDTLDIVNDSLEDAEPRLRLSVPANAAPVAWPKLQHGDETLFYADTLHPGETLVVTPLRPGDPDSGAALLIGPDLRPRRLGRDAVVYFTQSARFLADDQQGLRFADDDPDPDDPVARFARFGESALRTPLLPAGGARWTVGQFDRAQLEDLFGPDEVTRRFFTAPPQPLPASFDLELDWTAYPPATFQLQIPRNPAVRAAEAHGALALIHELVALARAAGITAWVDFPDEQDLTETGPEPADTWQLTLEPSLREPHPVATHLAVTLGLPLRERPSQDDALRVDHEVAYPLFAGIFAADDMAIGTRFNTSHIAPEDA